MFSAETLHFLTDLRSNNSRDWFQANRARYDAHVAGAAQGFGDALAAELQRLAGRPVTPKLFRLHRDLRFSKDKTPYNAHVHMSFSAGGPFAWLVGIDPGGLVLGYGALGFDAALLGRWFWWPQRVRPRPVPQPWPSVTPEASPPMIPARLSGPLSSAMTMSEARSA